MLYGLCFGRKDRSERGVLQFCFLVVTWKAPLCHKHQLVPSSSNSCFCACYSVSESCPTLCDPGATAYPASLSFTISLSLLKLMSTESVMPSNHLILCHPLLLCPQYFPASVCVDRATFMESLPTSAAGSDAFTVSCRRVGLEYLCSEVIVILL